MAEIKGFILSLIAAASASALIDGFVPEGGGMKKYLKNLISLMILPVLLSPLRELIGMVPAMLDNASFTYDSVEAMTRANSIVAMHIEAAMCEKFDIADEDAEAKFDGEKIVIRVREKLGLFESDIMRYVQLNFGTTAEVMFYE